MNRLQALGSGALALAILTGATVRPASADQAAVTRNTILGVAAAVAGIAIGENVAHKNAAANTIEGYTPSGAAVYQDGHVVLPNGQSYYPGNNGQSVACNNGSCAINGANGDWNGRYANGGWNGRYGNGGSNGRYDNGGWHRNQDGSWSRYTPANRDRR